MSRARSGLSARAELGLFLQRERRRRSLTLDDIAASTKVPRGSLDRLERGQWDGLPASVFVRGFVRAYGRMLDVEAEALKHFERALALPGIEDEQGASNLEDQAGPRADQTAETLNTHRRFGFALVLILVLIIVTLTVSMLWSASPRASHHRASCPVRRGSLSC